MICLHDVRNIVSSVPGTDIGPLNRIPHPRSGVAEGDYVVTHGRFSGNGRPAAWIAADIVRIEDGKLAEHWDVLQAKRRKPNP
jgi:predicted SnoaL-like aldol condensation-catalyzing enzyme